MPFSIADFWKVLFGFGKFLESIFPVHLAKSNGLCYTMCMRSIPVGTINENENIRIYKHLHTEPEPIHVHEFLEIAYVYKGCGWQTVNENTFFVKHGDLLILNMEDRHSFRPENGCMGITNCLIKPQFFGETLIDCFNFSDILYLTAFRKFSDLEQLQPLVQFSKKRFFEIENILDAAEKEFNEKQRGYLDIVRNYIEILLTKIFRELQKTDEHVYQESTEKIAPEILAYLEQNYDQKISLKELAQRSFYNPAYFSTIFKECFGKTLTQFINELRINEAIRLLKETNMPIEEIASKVGYHDCKNFYITFKKITNQTPSTYRSNINKV